MSKLNSISDLMSAALRDGKISDKAFQMIMDGLEIFSKLNLIYELKLLRNRDI